MVAFEGYQGKITTLPSSIPSEYPITVHQITRDARGLDSTYSLVEVDCVLARNDIGDGGTLGLARGLLGLGRHRGVCRGCR